jgi:ring-1,2-phenylacetyl-CoA epoxidase subunit PaaD
MPGIVMSTFSNHTDNTNSSSPEVEENKIWAVLEQVTDPEVPVLSIVDLGIVRDVKIPHSLSPLSASLEVTITITPTYSGCPAMDMIAMNIRIALLEHGYSNVKIKTVLSPAWTTDWMSEAGKEKLKAYGIAPPIGKSLDQKYLEDLHVECPQCHSTNTHLVSQFGSTSCKALFQCDDCKEPFDYFKCH